jgi:geranylgeranyl pyrophosphate synthase
MKGFCEDLDEGKYSLPLIHVWHNTPYAMELREILQQKYQGKAYDRAKRHDTGAHEGCRESGSHASGLEYVV